MHSRIRKALTPSSRGPWILVSAIALALLDHAVRARVRRGQAGPRRQAQPVHRRAPGATRARRRSSPTSRRYGTRQSNKSANGGGAIYGCRSGAGGTEKGNAPCVRASNLAKGRAFEFATATAHRGRPHHVDGDTNAAPFTTNADRRGHRPERRPGRRQERRRHRGRSSPRSPTPARWAPTAAPARRRTSAPVATRSSSPADISKCAYTVTEQGTSDNTGAASAEGAVANTVLVLTRAGGGADGTAPTPPANRAFHLVVTC